MRKLQSANVARKFLVNKMKKIFSKENLLRFFYSFIWLAVLVFALDLITKWVVVNHFGVEAVKTNTAGYITVIPNFLFITATTNNGAAWSLGDNMRPFWIVVSVVLSGGLIAYYIWKRKTMTSIIRASLMLMIAGAIGNMIDRCFYWEGTVGFSGVVDWIAVWLPWGKWFPYFNIADSALVIGVFILLIVLIIELVKEVKEKDKAGYYDLKPAEMEAKEKEAEQINKENEENKD